MSVLLMTKDFDLLTETPIHGKDFGQGKAKKLECKTNDEYC